MQKKLSWQAYAKGERNKVIDAIKSSISTNEACIVNFNLFSDLALTLSIEIEEANIVLLHNALSQIVDKSDIDIQDINSEYKKEWIIFMNISFT